MVPYLVGESLEGTRVALALFGAGVFPFLRVWGLQWGGMCAQVGFDVPGQDLESVPWQPCGKVLLPCVVEARLRMLEGEVKLLREGLDAAGSDLTQIVQIIHADGLANTMLDLGD